MSIENAGLWLERHSGDLAALYVSIVPLRSDEETSRDIKISEYFQSDPALALALLKKVNASRPPSSGKEIVSSAQAAISLLGEKVARELILEIEIAEQSLQQQQQLFFYSQIVNRSYHANQQYLAWARLSGYHQLDDYCLPALLYFIGEALCCQHDFTLYRQYIESGQKPESEQSLFGFTFKHLTLAVAEKFNLPLLIAQAQLSETSKSQQARLLLNIAQICQTIEHGWYQVELEENYQQLADILSIPEQRVITGFHQHAVEFSRISPFQHAWQPASRLLLVADSIYKFPITLNAGNEKPKPDPKKNPQTNDTIAATSASNQSGQNTSNTVDQLYQKIIKSAQAILKQENPSQSQLLQSLIKQLYSTIGLPRVCLFLHSRDRKILQNRMAPGVDKASPFATLQLPIEQAGLLKTLMLKPQAIHLSDKNFNKYMTLLPARLLACNQTHDFMAMSLFIAGKPVALVYADRYGENSNLSDQDFRNFKQTIAYYAKALTWLQKNIA